MRYKNRYLLFELLWKDGKLDDSISERVRGCRSRAAACATVAARHNAPSSCVFETAGEGVLLGAFRDSLQQNFGDHGLGTALASLQGEPRACVLKAMRRGRQAAAAPPSSR